MRVLLAVEQLRRRVPGGIGRYASSLLDGLVSCGPDDKAPPVELYASRPPAGAPDPLARWGLPVVTSPLPGRLLTRAWDRRLASAPGGYDAVHAVSLAAPPVRRTGPVRGGGGRRGAAMVVTVHDVAWRRYPEATTAGGRRWHEAALGRALRRADVLAVPSQAVADDIRAAGAAAGSVVVLPPGADHLPPGDAAGAAGLLGRLGVTGHYLLSAGTLEPRKNLTRLLAAYRAARASLPEPWPLVVVGPPGWGEAGLAGEVPQGVVATGPVPDGVLAALYQGARVFAYVPLVEGFGFPPVEAMSCRVPVVASTGVPSVAPGGRYPPGERYAAGGRYPPEEPDPLDGEPGPALRVDPRSVDAIAGALVAASVDDAVRADLIERGQAWVRPMTWRRAARAHLALWESLA